MGRPLDALSFLEPDRRLGDDLGGGIFVDAVQPDQGGGDNEAGTDALHRLHQALSARAMIEAQRGHVGDRDVEGVEPGAGGARDRVATAFVATAFARKDSESAKAQWRLAADHLRPKVSKLAALMDEAEHDVLTYMTFPREHRQKLLSTNLIERLHAEIKRRTNVVGIFPNEDAIARLVGAILLEQNDEWAVARRYMTLESISPVGDNLTVKLSAVAA